MAKNARYGQAAIIEPEDWELLLWRGFRTQKERALFATCRYTGCRISEACQLLARDVGAKTITFRRGTTKGKISTRQAPIHPALKKILKKYQPGELWFFPGNQGNFLSPKSADRWLRQACARVGLEGVSTHSFRRTALTEMAAAGIPLHVIQNISGHRDLKVLSRYLECSDSDKNSAIGALS